MKKLIARVTFISFLIVILFFGIAETQTAFASGPCDGIQQGTSEYCDCIVENQSFYYCWSNSGDCCVYTQNLNKGCPDASSGWCW